MDGNLASTYTLIHAFLTKHSHTKAAQAVKKAVKEVVILKDGVEIEGPQLDEIIVEWKLLVANKKSTPDLDSDSSSSSSSSSSNRKTKKVKGIKKKASPSSSSSSSQADSSESDSSESDSDSSSSSGSDSDSKPDSPPPIKTSVVQSKAKVLSPPVKNTSSESSSSGSGSESDDESKSNDLSTQKLDKTIKHDTTSSESSSSDSGSESDNESKSNDPSTQKLDKIIKHDTTSESSSSDSGSESDDESESSDPITQKLDKIIKSNTDQNPKVERDSSRTLSSEDASSSSLKPESDNTNEDKESYEVQTTKKRRTDRDGTAVVTATTATVRREETQAVFTGRIKGSNARSGRQANERFRRVDPTKVEPIADNRYVAKDAPKNDYGQRAHEALIVTRGQGFRKEKNKKKRGSYRGGEITMESHSFKFA